MVKIFEITPIKRFIDLSDYNFLQLKKHMN